jgi:hypothetical protein
MLTPTVIMMMVTALTWLVWDIVLYIKGKTTISRYIVNFAYYSPTVPLIIGFLCGHFFFPMNICK